MKSLYWLSGLFLLASSLSAQDPHFSQFFFSGLDINPANTGRMEGRARMTTIYRTQWNTVLGAKAYQSAYAAFESQISCLSDGFFAIGVMGKYDRVGDIKLTRSYGHLSLAYHHRLDKRNRYLSAGFQLGVISSRFQLSRWQFDEQFDGVGFNPSLPSFEEMNATGNNVMDFNVGLSYYDTESFTFGLSLFHVTQPNNAFFDETDFRLGLGLGLHGALSDEDSRWGVRFFYRKQSLVKNRQWYALVLPNFILIGKHKRDQERLQLAIGPRLAGQQNPGFLTLDALLVNVLFRTGKTTLSVNYDLNISSLSKASNTFGAFEFAFSIPIATKDNCVYCPSL